MRLYKLMRARWALESEKMSRTKKKSHGRPIVFCSYTVDICTCRPGAKTSLNESSIVSSFWYYSDHWGHRTYVTEDMSVDASS